MRLTTTAAARVISAGLALTGALEANTRAADKSASSSGAQSRAALSVMSKSFAAGATIPKIYTGEGKDISPEISWGQAPAGTAVFALTCEDPDAPNGRWFHWIIFN